MAYQIFKEAGKALLIAGRETFSTLDKRVLNGKIEVLKITESYESAAN